MALLPNILPAHPEAPESIVYEPDLPTGLIGRIIRRAKQGMAGMRELRELRSVSDRTLKDLGLHRSGLRMAHRDRFERMGSET